METALLILLFGWIKYDLEKIKDTLLIVQGCGVCNAGKGE